MANVQMPVLFTISDSTGATLFGENITADLIENHLPFTLDRSGAFHSAGFDQVVGGVGGSTGGRPQGGQGYRRGPLARRAPHRIRQDHHGGPLSPARRVVSGYVRAGGAHLWRRRRSRPAHLRLYLETLVHARDAGPLQWRGQSRPAHFLLPELGG